MSEKQIPRQIQINDSWYEVSEEGWSGKLNLNKFAGPIEYTASRPYAHTDDYFVYDMNGNKVGEFNIGNRSYSGNVTGLM